MRGGWVGSDVWDKVPKKTFFFTPSLSPDSDKTYVAKDSTFRPDLNERVQFYGTLLLVEN